MKREDLLPYVGKVVACDLINRERPVCRIESISDDGIVLLKNPTVYVPVQQGNAVTVTGVPYAAPLHQVKELAIPCDLIITLLPVPAQMEQEFVRVNSGLITGDGVSKGLILS